MSAFRPLPPRPSLEFEHKEAKALLRRLRAGDPESLARARAQHPAIDASAPARIRLADAQLVLAREYGFASWPRLVRYFGDLERQAHAHRSTEAPDFYDGVARSLLAEHRQRRWGAGRAFAAYVPRLYGKPLDEVFAAEVTEAEARLATARMYGFSSWEVLGERTVAEARRRPSEWEVDPMGYASKAMEAADLQELKRVVETHPDLLHPTDYEVAKGRSLRWLLDRGADPNWVAPNGIPVLEHALIRYWNGDAVDALAARAVPRKALWISAGLGDVDGIRRFLDVQGKPTPAARRLRPAFDAIWPAPWPSHPDPDDEEIRMEAFIVAMLNGRTSVLEYMVSRGVPIDSLVYGTPVINVAVGNAWTPVVDCLVRCGADLDLRGWRPQQSAREIAREWTSTGFAPT